MQSHLSQIIGDKLNVHPIESGGAFTQGDPIYIKWFFVFLYLGSMPGGSPNRDPNGTVWYSPGDPIYIKWLIFIENHCVWGACLVGRQMVTQTVRFGAVQGTQSI